MRHWLHRLAWVMIILPKHSLLQSVKTLGNLFSIVFTSRDSMVRVVALTGVPGVFLGFLVLLVLCELLLIPGLIPFLPDYAAPDTGSIHHSLIWNMLFAVFWVTIYLGFLKMLFPAIDLVLDVSNYHLADEMERRNYFSSLEEGVARLVYSGVKEIHILAHSLGVVITYDWLQSTDNVNLPVTVLHTIGSPLDKFWYIDHSGSRRQLDSQGLSVKRLSTWDNYWAWSDPVSGQLDHYAISQRPIENHRTHWLGPYFLSHVKYWKNKTVIKGIRDRIITRDPNHP